MGGEFLGTAVREHLVDRPVSGHSEMDGGLCWDECVAIVTELTKRDALIHARRDLYRAALEATAIGVRHSIETMTAAGAGDRSRRGRWRRCAGRALAADRLRRGRTCPGDTDRHHRRETFGAAYLAVALEHRVSIEAWNTPSGLCEPDLATKAGYDELYGRYLDLYPATRNINRVLADRQKTPTPTLEEKP